MRIAINGYGRIGRSFVRALVEREQQTHAGAKQSPLTLVAINDLGSAEDLLYLTKNDSSHGPFPGAAAIAEGKLQIEQQNG